jgi:NADH:flavin oxidoreductase / NADH oxidase family
MPVMVVGGFRTTAAMMESLERGELDVIGLGRPIIADPEVPKRMLSGEVDRAPSPEAALHPFHLLPWNNLQLERLADGLEPDLSLDGAAAVAQFTELETGNMSALLQHRAQALV